jgi:hypothetical protein
MRWSEHFDAREGLVLRGTVPFVSFASPFAFRGATGAKSKVKPETPAGAVDALGVIGLAAGGGFSPSG